VAARMGKLPTPAEFLAIYKERVEPNKEKIYRYLQFDEMAEYK
jgi:aconitate hydratase 2 / 2-methylisocitrate dehydratase